MIPAMPSRIHRTPRERPGSKPGVIGAGSLIRNVGCVMHKRHLFLPITLGLLLVTKLQAWGCSFCATAAVDAVLPPIFLWGLLAMTWFVSNGVIRSATGIQLSGQPKLVGAVVLPVVGLIAAGAFFGFGIVLLLFAPAFSGFVSSLRSGVPGTSDGGRRATRIVGAMHLFGIIGAMALLINSHLTRTPEQYIAKWGFHGLGRQRFKDLRDKEPRSLDAYRFLVQRGGSSYVVVEAVERIGEIGEPGRDIPLIRSVLERFVLDGSAVRQIHAAIERLELRTLQLKAPNTKQFGPANGSQPTPPELQLKALNTQQFGPVNGSQPFRSE